MVETMDYYLKGYFPNLIDSAKSTGYFITKTKVSKNSGIFDNFV